MMPNFSLAMDKTYRRRPDVVPPRPARARQRGALPRAAQLPAGALRRSCSTRAILDAAAARATGGSSSSASRWSQLDADLRRAGRPGRGPDRAARPRRARRCRALARRLGVQAVFANRDDEPAALARDAQVRGALADAGIALAHLQGPGGLRARRGADAGGPALRGVHAVQERLAGEGRRVLPASPIRCEQPCRARWRRGRRPTARAGARAGGHRLRADQPGASCRCRPAPRGGAQLFDDFLAAHRPLRRDARLPGRARARAT